MLSKKPGSDTDLRHFRLKKLTDQHVKQIDDLIAVLEEHGEVRLIVQRGVLKYINKVEKYKTWNADEQQLDGE